MEEEGGAWVEEDPSGGGKTGSKFARSKSSPDISKPKAHKARKEKALKKSATYSPGFKKGKGRPGVCAKRAGSSRPPAGATA